MDSYKFYTTTLLNKLVSCAWVSSGTL